MTTHKSDLKMKSKGRSRNRGRGVEARLARLERMLDEVNAKLADLEMVLHESMASEFEDGLRDDEYSDFGHVDY